MKSIVGFLFFLLFMAGFAFVLLQGRQMAETTLGGGGVSITGINWRPVRIGADSIPDDSGMFVMFAVDGSIKGNGGCNGFFGSLEKTESGIAIGPLGATRRACPEVIMAREMALLGALEKTVRFQISDAGLQLLGEDNLLLAEFVESSQE
jgi:putative lipoprotein